MPWGRKRLVQFDKIDVAQAEAGALEQLLHGRRRADAHDAGFHAGGGHGHDARARREAMALGGVVAGDEQGGGAVVDARGIAGGDGARIAERGLQLGELFEGRLGTGVFVLADDRVALATLDGDGGDLAGEEAGGLGSAGLVLATEREAVLGVAGDLELLRDVLAGLRHGIGAVHRLHQPVDEAPADGGVVNLGSPGERFGGLALHERGAGHALDTAGQHEFGLAGADGTGGGADGVEAAAAKAVDGAAGDAGGQPGEQRGHARDVAVVFARLIGAAHVAIVELIPVDAGVALLEHADRVGGQIVGSDVLQRAGVAADRGAREVADEGVRHRNPPEFRLG